MRRRRSVTSAACATSSTGSGWHQGLPHATFAVESAVENIGGEPEDYRQGMAAFHVFDSAPSRLRFRVELGTDDQTWPRARGWALTQGLEALVYYIDSHPGMVAMARQVIKQTLDSAD